MVRFLCVAAFLAPLPAADLTAQELLQKTSAKYQSIDSFVIHVSVVEHRAPERSWMKKMTIAGASVTKLTFQRRGIGYPWVQRRRNDLGVRSISPAILAASASDQGH